MQDKFRTFAQDKQVPLGELKTNPFFHESQVTRAPVTVIDEAEMARREAEALRRRQEEVAAAAGRLTLTTVFAGTRPTCIINGKVCEVGTLIDGFRIEEITRETVRVSRDGFTFDLAMRQRTR